ncbi:MAG: hypothetical protein KDD55_01745 [Bdellovibrionales bacterium]|nr:hypothetical protein [Bdellovibrionales bacterium]
MLDSTPSHSPDSEDPGSLNDLTPPAPPGTVETLYPETYSSIREIPGSSLFLHIRSTESECLNANDPLRPMITRLAIQRLGAGKFDDLIVNIDDEIKGWRFSPSCTYVYAAALMLVELYSEAHHHLKNSKVLWEEIFEDPDHVLTLDEMGNLTRVEQATLVDREQNFLMKSIHSLGEIVTSLENGEVPPSPIILL